MSKKKAIRSHYQPRISPQRESYDVLDWASAASQKTRFGVLVAGVDLRGKSLLDVGAGLGDLWAYLKQRRIDVDYTGVDILDDMAEAARQRYPDARFVTGDIFTDSPFAPASFDVLFCSGVFNLNLGNNLEFVPLALPVFFALARETVVFNMLHHRYQSAGKRYFYYDPDQIVAMLRELPCQVRLVDDYLPNDFTLICRKDVE